MTKIASTAPPKTASEPLMIGAHLDAARNSADHRARLVWDLDTTLPSKAGPQASRRQLGQQPLGPTSTTRGCDAVHMIARWGVN